MTVLWRLPVELDGNFIFPKLPVAADTFPAVRSFYPFFRSKLSANSPMNTHSFSFSDQKGRRMSFRAPLATVVLAAASLLTPNALAVDATPTPSPTPVLMPTGPGNGNDTGDQPFDSAPGPNSPTYNILMYGKDPLDNTVTTNTIRITNNTGHTVYPVLRTPNNKTMAGNPNKGLYDPFDPPNREYRGYIGYQNVGPNPDPAPADDKYYFGLRAGESILVEIPFVFWNGARIHVGTEAAYIWAFGDVNNPLHNRATGIRSITKSATVTDPAQSNSIPNGVVMWYRNDTPPGMNPPPDALPTESPSDDSHDQIAEFTIRDNGYLVKISSQSGDQIPDTELVTLMNYDVSNVDNLFLPMAMAANDVWIFPNKTDPAQASNPSRPNLTGGYTPGNTPEAVGWTGAIGSIADLQDKIKLFTADNALLGNYFGGKGWPFYNFPGAGVDPSVPLKIPSGANIFPGSPLKGLGDRSSYNNEKYLLSSGGTGLITSIVGVSGDQSGLADKQVRLGPNEDQSKIDFIEVGQVATGGPIPADTTVTGVDHDTRVVTLSNSWGGSIVGSVLTFTRPKRDYASEAMIRLWFSWVKYYLSQWPIKNPGSPDSQVVNIDHIDAETATMYFNDPHPELTVGMSVEGPGLNTTDTQTETGVAAGLPVILQIAEDHKSVVLSQVPGASFANTNYTFYAPTNAKAKLRYTPDQPEMVGYPMFGAGVVGYPAFVFSGSQQEGQDPWEFSQSIYLAMASLNQIAQNNSDTVFKAMQNVIGGNMGYIFNQAGKDSEDGQAVIAMIRDRIKSVLRGVSDFTKYKERNATGALLWYPDPKLDNWGTGFNIFNLDPYVWFVHEVLHFTGYGFSLDDDTAQVGAGGANQLQLSITEFNGLIKGDIPWTIQAPWGPVVDKILPYSGPANDSFGEFIPHDNKSISAGPMTVTTFEPHKLRVGDKISIQAVLPADSPANGKFTVRNVTKFTFDLYDFETGQNPVSTGTAPTAPGNWFLLPRRPYVETTNDPAHGFSNPVLNGNNLTTVYYRVLGDDALNTFLGASVSVKGPGGNVIPQPVPIRVWQPRTTDTGRLAFNANIKSADGITDLPAGNYSFTFGAISTLSSPPTPNPTPNPGVVSQALQQLRTIKRSIRSVRNTQTGSEKRQAIDELRFAQDVAQAVIVDSHNAALDHLLDQTVKATKIKNDTRRKKKFKQLKKRFKRLT